MELSLSALEWLAAIAIVFTGTVIQASVGFGVALFSAPLLYLVDPALVPAPLMVVGLVVSVLVVWRERDGVVMATVGRILPGLALGTAAAATVLGVLPRDALALLFGGLVLVAVGLSWVRPPLAPGGGLLFAAGGLSGFMGTTTAIGGPPLALVFQNQSGSRLRGTLAACFAPAALLSLVALWAVDHMGLPEARVGAALLPAVAVGFLVSRHTARALDRTWLRHAVLAVSAVAGVAAIIRALV